MVLNALENCWENTRFLFLGFIKALRSESDGGQPKIY